MTTDAVPAGPDPRRLLDDARALARRVRLAQRVTWLPLLVLGLVTLGAIPVYRLFPPILSDCAADGTCTVFYRGAQIYWWTALLLGYLVIAAGYLRVARSRGLGARVLPYVLTGIALVLLSAAATVLALGLGEPSAALHVVLRLLDPPTVIGLALLALAWLERRATLLVFALGYLAVVLTPINLGWGAGWGDEWGMAPQLAINGGLLLLGSGFFALRRFR
ncbi:hypothetical protein [Catenuloplanes japonicus]|uniref:hypothetical protein n=1 Tax=Catenuloplanes japonicus TaxID=33876 RepID=UPI000525D411|nr:hypothetical protein [Catenuloplanes japonicus]